MLILKLSRQAGLEATVYPGVLNGSHVHVIVIIRHRLHLLEREKNVKVYRCSVEDSTIRMANDSQQLERFSKHS